MKFVVSLLVLIGAISCSDDAADSRVPNAATNNANAANATNSGSNNATNNATNGSNSATNNTCACENEVCSDDDGTCVECNVDADCAEGFCSDGHLCSECLDDSQCPNGRCLPSTLRCVSCLSADDCDGETPICGATNECEACSSATQCANQLPDTPVCEIGRCVECAQFLTDACGEFLCDINRFTCSDTARAGSAGPCDVCIADEHCADGLVCIREIFEESPLEWRCMPEQVVGPGCPQAPFYAAITTLSISQGLPVRACELGPETTCSAYLDKLDATVCNDDADCGSGSRDDGICAGTTCTIPCDVAQPLSCPVGEACIAGECG